MRSISLPAPVDQDTLAALVAAAEVSCRASGTQLTEVRRGLLKILWLERRPLGAYDLLTRLEGSLGRRFGPTSVYRGLEFLKAIGLITRIESLNAFVICAHPGQAHSCMFFVCDSCGSSAEVENPALEQLLAHDARSLDFEVRRKVLELQGICAQCRMAV